MALSRKNACRLSQGVTVPEGVKQSNVSIALSGNETIIPVFPPFGVVEIMPFFTTYKFGIAFVIPAIKQEATSISLSVMLRICLASCTSRRV